MSTPEKMSAKRTPPRVAVVRSSEPLTPRMVRIVLGGDGLEGFAAGPFSDHYVKLQIPPTGAPYSPPFDPTRVKAELPRDLWPRVRTYSVRHWNPEARELTIDFVHHGATGVAGPWASSAQVGDQVQLVGPGGAYAPDPEADWHLMVGDACVIPSIAASLQRIRAGVPIVALISVDDEDEEQPLSTPGELRLTWIHRDPSAELGEDPLVAALTGLELPAGRVHAYVHGEAGMVREVRRHLIADRGIDRESLSASGYWKRRRTEEGWREDKPEWNRQVEADLA